jgi:hypothetical protein
MKAEVASMAVTIAELKEKLARVQQDLAEVSASLDQLESANGGPQTVAGPIPLAEALVAGVDFVDPRTFRELADEAFRKMGIDITAPAPTPEEVQALMIREGIRPEDRIFTRALYEMREE